MRTILIVLFSSFFFANESQASLCPIVPTFLPSGICQTYPTNGSICSSILGGQSVYVNAGQEIMDGIALQIINVMVSNQDIVGTACRISSDAFICNSIYLPCHTAPPSPEGIPSLPCQTYCDNFWAACQVVFDAFFIGAIVGLGQPLATFTFPFCVNGTFSVTAPQPADVFGVRYIPGMGLSPEGYANQTRYPASSATFHTLSNTALTVPCVNPTNFAPVPIDTVPFGETVSCPFPLGQ